MNRNTVPKSGRLPVQAISDTSALVLLWCGEEIYQSDAVRQYAGMLDLSRGRELLARCHAVWEEYDRVIRYRKLCIAREAETILAGGHIRQVVIPGAGYSMLGIELASRFAGLKVFEIDSSGMREKRGMVERLAVASGSSLSCLEGDVEDHAGLRRLLSGAGWQDAAPTLTIVEGLSYYLSRESALGQWRNLAEGSMVVFEYLVPYGEVNPERRDIPRLVFGEIMQYCSFTGEFSFWREEEVRSEPGFVLERFYTLEGIERSLGEFLGSGQRIFRVRGDGWIEIAVLKSGEGRVGRA
ncbi:MAG TPA: hypothetical protein DEQ23_05545 [Chlorobium sp.]|uniref:O-methyltransferase involved in polyketide biosynthesis n=1 Tax=Chlorobium phaeovibrioides (strain DSM 265 / 1930) TaxID=290318 RepID=A4SFL7_CHLPM|nr:hypothetical protein [Chlorobium sp.]